MADDFFGFGSNPLEGLVGRLFAGLADPGGETRRAERFGRDLIGCTIGAIDRDFETVEAQPLRESRLGKMNVATAGIVDPP